MNIAASGNAVPQGHLGSELALLRGLIDLLPDIIFVKDAEGRFLVSNQAHVRVLGALTEGDVIGKTDFAYFAEPEATRNRAEEVAVMTSEQPMSRQDTLVDHNTGKTRVRQTIKLPLRDSSGKIIGVAGIVRDVIDCTSEFSKTIDTLNREDTAPVNSQVLLDAMLDNIPDWIYFKDTQSRILKLNRKLAKDMGMADPEEAVGKTDSDFRAPEQAREFYADEQRILQSGEPLINKSEKQILPNGEIGWTSTTKAPMRDRQGKIVGLVGINRDITRQKQGEDKLEKLHKELVDASRAAGMAEVAIGVLHNVGNVLNSVNVSASLICTELKNSKLKSLTKLTELLRSQGPHLSRFMSEDERGRKIVPFMEGLAQHLQQEQDTLGSEAHSLVSKVEHIKEIVAAQQSYARVCGIMENVALSELVEDALKIHGTAFERHDVSLVREFDSIPILSLDKHKVLQILLNLLHNAKYACDASNRPDKQVAIRIKSVGGNRVTIQVADNGIGIPPESMTRVFTQGFTTRKGGHGFGLHSGALAARELGGTLTVHSDGAGKGASFTLELPMTSPLGDALAHGC